MIEEDSFLALVHNDGEIKHRSREGVKFTKKIQPTCSSRRELVWWICNAAYNVESIVMEGSVWGVKYGCFAIEADKVLQVLFHCRKHFPEVRTTVLFVEMLDPLASSGGSARNPHSANVSGLSHPAIQHDTEAHQVASPRFGFDLQAEAADYVGDSGDTRSFKELAVAITAAPHLVSIPFIEGDSDDESGLVPTQQGGASSSGTQQYPPHLSTLNLDALSGPGRVDGESNSGRQGSQGSSNQAEFVVGQIFVNKDVAVLAMKNYNIRRGVEYRVMELDHAKYHGRCKLFGQGCNWLIRLTLRKRKGLWEV
ncbi:hypothetical protein PIB30_083371 [Stylosanthes scabra]|uniref:Transposase MuDR plant domain-containing protein n=1 Tax=Stylosanthes scabra TaxID=79078 RepID=A0ABU6RSJ0_9FABA|nr:hypothetical protein [Stylosanthes scabra]